MAVVAEKLASALARANDALGPSVNAALKSVSNLTNAPDRLLALAAAAAAALAAGTMLVAKRRDRSRRRSFTLGYWKIRGLAAPARMILTYAGAPYDDATYELQPRPDGGWSNAEWSQAKRPLKEALPLMNLPYLVDHHSGAIITQSNAVFQYLGRVLGLMGRDEAEISRVEMTLCETLDLRNETVRICYPFHGTKKFNFRETLEKHVKGLQTGHYEKLDLFLGERPFFAGENPTVADFPVWEMLDQHELMCKKYSLASPLQKFSKLEAFYRRVRQIPQLKPYFESDAYGLPCNNKMANFL